MSNRFIPDRQTGSTADTTEPSGGYEFSSTDNDVFRGVASMMKFVGVMSSLFGVLELISGFNTGMTLTGLLTVGQGIALMAIGGWLAAAAGSFRDVAETEGNDIGNLMLAMAKLRSVYTLQAWLMGAACALMIVAIVVALHH